MIGDIVAALIIFYYGIPLALYLLGWLVVGIVWLLTEGLGTVAWAIGHTYRDSMRTAGRLCRVLVRH